MAKRKTWIEKRRSGKSPKTVVLDKPFAGVTAGARLFIATPELVDAWIKTIPEGETRTIMDMRQDFAMRENADATCPASTAIFVRVVAEAALEEMAAGAKSSAVTPFWRVIEPESALAKKLSCGSDYIRDMRMLERSSQDLAA